MNCRPHPSGETDMDAYLSAWLEAPVPRGTLVHGWNDISLALNARPPELAGPIVWESTEIVVEHLNARRLVWDAVTTDVVTVTYRSRVIYPWHVMRRQMGSSICSRGSHNPIGGAHAQPVEKQSIRCARNAAGGDDSSHRRRRCSTNV